jgi:hypothetical protein
MSTFSLSRAGRPRSIAAFTRHLLEMTLAMMVGMLAFGTAVGVISAGAGSSLENVRVEQPELFVLGMASSMSVTMVAWMLNRGHTRRSSGEMTAAMFVPAFALIVCYWLGAVAAGSVCPLACAAMIPAMVVAMLYRLEVYTAHVSRTAAAR